MLEREEIYRRVCGYEMAHGDRSVDVFVRKLRSKIEKQSPGWEYIHTHFGIGYLFEAEQSHDERPVKGSGLPTDPAQTVAAQEHEGPALTAGPRS